MGSCQNYGSLLGPLNTRCRLVIGTQRWTMVLTTILPKKELRRSLQGEEAEICFVGKPKLPRTSVGLADSGQSRSTKVELILHPAQRKSMPLIKRSRYR